MGNNNTYLKEGGTKIKIIVYVEDLEFDKMKEGNSFTAWNKGYGKSTYHILEVPVERVRVLKTTDEGIMYEVKGRGNFEIKK